MKTVIAHVLGPPETLSFEDLPPRPVGPAELRIRVHYAGVSFVDVLVAAGGYQVKPPTPFIPGSELSGEVIEAGANVAGFAPGDRVAAGAFGGTFTEEAILAASSASHIPANLSMAQAAVLRSSYVTACYALRRRANVQPGESVLVLGAGGAIGIAAVQLSKAFGARVIASASSQDKRALALANGAADAIDSGAQDWRQQVKALTGGKGVDIVVDPLGGGQSERAFRSLAWGGRHLVVGFATGEIPALPTNLALLKGAALLGVDIRQFGIHEPAASREVWAEVSTLAASGVARPPIARIFPFDQYVEAMHEAASGRSAGRIVLKMPAAG